MRTRVYEIADHDVMALYFDDDAPVRPLANLGTSFGKLIFDGTMAIIPDLNDALLINGEDDAVDEYIILCRVFHADDNCVILYVHMRHFEKMEVS